MPEQQKTIPFPSLSVNEINRDPAAATARYKLLLLGLFTMAYFLFYVLPNFQPFSQPRLLPTLSIERAIPFMPWTFLVYLSEYILIAITIILLKSKAQFNTFARQAFGALFIIGTIFMFFPTTYLRPVYPH